MKRIRLGCLIVGWASFAATSLSAAEPTREQLDFFEKSIRPLLTAHCLECHGPKKQESGLRVDSRAAVLRGGERGPAAVTGDAGSLLVQAVRHAGELKMPPEGKLKPTEVAAIERWVSEGLAWPDGAASTAGPLKAPSVDEARATHWAFQPVRKTRVPPVSQPGWARTPIDRFIQAKLESRGLSPSPPADRRTLIRRATFDLLGLPPTPGEVAAFLADPAPDAAAFARVVERLLASPHYGERWGRHWLDVARYADNKGYVFFEDKAYPWAYTYRDYVVRSLNEDLPYDRFVQEQLAADLLDLGNDRRPLTALGFLTVGNRFMNNTHDIVDDRIDVIARGFLGLTVTCARCHDHKYDPISQADYYGLYGVMQSCTEPTVLPLFEPPAETEAYRTFVAEMAAREKKLHDFVDRKHTELVTSGRTRAGEYMLAAHNLRNKPRTENFMLLTDKGELNPVMIERWKAFLAAKRTGPHGMWSYWNAVSALPEKDFAAAAAKALAEYAPPDGKPAAANRPINPHLKAALLKQPPKSIADVTKVYGELFKKIDAEWQAVVRPDGTPLSKEAKGVDTAKPTDHAHRVHALGAPPTGQMPTRLDDPAAEEIRQVLYGPGSPPDVHKSLDWGFLSLLPDRPSQGEFQKLLKEIENWSRTGPGAPPRAMALVDAPQPFVPRIFQRGNPNRPGQIVPRQFVAVLSPERKPFQQGSGRLELARAITDPANPLTARVIVNRVWMHHFGQGLVDTPGDFGLRSNPPSHPELLDYLAATLVENGWSLKDLHRQMMNSAAYQQNAEPPPSSAFRVSHSALGIDPENRLLWRANRRRLEFEALRDALLAVCDSLEPRIGGPPVELFAGQFTPRRSIYGSIDRMDLPPLLSTFDFPSPATSSPRRDNTTVPPQALFLMNHPFVQEAARRIATTAGQSDPASKTPSVTLIYERLFSRPPTAAEQRLAAEYLGEKPAAERLAAYVHGLLMLNEFAFVD